MGGQCTETLYPGLDVWQSDVTPNAPAGWASGEEPEGAWALGEYPGAEHRGRPQDRRLRPHRRCAQ